MILTGTEQQWQAQSVVIYFGLIPRMRTSLATKTKRDLYSLDALREAT